MRWAVEHPLMHFHYCDPKAPWYGRLYNVFRQKCPHCKCLDLHHVGQEWTTLASGKRVVLGAIQCVACRRRWDWDDDGR